MVRPPAELVYAEELDALAATDTGSKPSGWKLSPRSVRQFILGSDGATLSSSRGDKKVKTVITQKFYGDDALVERCIVTLLGNRGLLLVGEPGTAKSMLSEMLAAAVSGNSLLTIQGTAGTTDDQIKYSWNYALLLAEGPSLRALVPSPLFTGMKSGAIVRFEEITRCQPEIQDTLVSLLSEKTLQVPELTGEDGVLFAEKGFNIIATANLRDRCARPAGDYFQRLASWPHGRGHRRGEAFHGHVHGRGRGRRAFSRAGCRLFWQQSVGKRTHRPPNPRHHFKRQPGRREKAQAIL